MSLFYNVLFFMNLPVHANRLSASEFPLTRQKHESSLQSRNDKGFISYAQNAPHHFDGSDKGCVSDCQGKFHLYLSFSLKKIKKA